MKMQCRARGCQTFSFLIDYFGMFQDPHWGRALSGGVPS